MLSDEEKRGLLDMARSAAIREEFRALRAASAIPPPPAVMDVDALIAFLTAMNRILPLPPPRRTIEYARAIL